MTFPQPLFDKLMILLMWGEKNEGGGNGIIVKKNILVHIQRGSYELISQSSCDLN